MTKEEKYTKQLRSQGLYDPVLAPAVHELCILERELPRLRKEWSATAKPGQKPSFDCDLYDKIIRLNGEIRAARSSLLRSAKLLKSARTRETDDQADIEQSPLAKIRAKHPRP